MYEAWKYGTLRLATMSEHNKVRNRAQQTRKILKTVIQLSLIISNRKFFSATSKGLICTNLTKTTNNRCFAVKKITNATFLDELKIFRSLHLILLSATVWSHCLYPLFFYNFQLICRKFLKIPRMRKFDDINRQIKFCNT